MPEYLSPGVYVEEIQTGNKPIEGVSTSTAGMVGVTERGPTNVPQLVTSFGDYRRLFGDWIPADEFTDVTGVRHNYLPHAVEGFFVNGGRRAYVTRVVPDQATLATRELFFEDIAVVNLGDTVLLRAAQQGTGTAVNLPLLYVLDPGALAVNDWVRIGNGSRAEYRQVAAIGGAVAHVALNFPLHFAHAAATAVRAVPVTPSVALAPPTFTFAVDAEVGATEIVLNGADAAGLVAALPPAAPPGTTLLFELGQTTAAEYAFAVEAIDLGGGDVRVRLATPLRLGYASLEPAQALDVPAGTASTLSIAASGGELLVYPATIAGDFTAVANIVVFELGTGVQEAHGIGELSTLPITVPVYGPYPSGSVGQRVSATDDDRTLITDNNPVIELDRVDGLAIGMTLTFEVGGVPEDHIVDDIDEAANEVTLRAPGLSGATTSPTVVVPAKTLTALAGAGAFSIALDDRLGLLAGDVLRVGADEIVRVREVVGERGAPPDAGALILEQPLRAEHVAGTVVRQQVIAVDLAQQAVYLMLGATGGDEGLLVSDGTGYAAGDVVQLTLPDTSVVFHRLAATAVPQNPREIELSAALERGHAAGQPLVERTPLLELRALDAGGWGNRLLAGCREESKGLAANADVLAANPPAGPGTFSSLQLTSLTGVEPGTILEMLDPVGLPLNLPLLKVRRLDRPNRLALLDPAGLQGAHMTAHNNAQLAGQRVRVRSREFSLMIMLRRRPDPAVPTRNDDLLDQEVFRHLSIDPRHSRYVMRILGATWTIGNTDDDLGIPLRRWDRRSEGESAYVRALDLAAPVDREAIRLGPEALVDIMPSGLTRPARHPFAGGDDATVLMNDALYAGADNDDADLRTGIFTLKNLLNVSLVGIPGQTGAALQQALIDHCEEMRYCFAVLDGPRPPNDTLTDVQNQRQQFDTKYAALYHPWLTIPDPFPTSVGTVRQYEVPTAGHVMGIFARVDNERGVHKAPANEVVRGITGYTRYFTKGEQDVLNAYPVNINLFRDFRVQNRGLRLWGARCITSDSDYKYVNVRRLLIFIEHSVDRGLQWVVFEPNAEDLWARVRRSVSNFLTTVWRNGALEGTTVEQAFFVRCDRTTMTRDDIDNGRLICVIGVAPVKPAEFVIIRIGLWTADAQA